MKSNVRLRCNRRARVEIRWGLGALNVADARIVVTLVLVSLFLRPKPFLSILELVSFPLTSLKDSRMADTNEIIECLEAALAEYDAYEQGERVYGLWVEKARAIIGEHAKPPHTCQFCGAPSWLDPIDQCAPADYCHESDHGEPDEQG